MIFSRPLMILATCLLPVTAFAQETSQDDKGYLTRLLEDSLGGEGRTVSITGFRGALSSTAQIDQITFSDSVGVWLTLDDLSLQWNRSALLRGRIDVTQLAAKTIILDRAPSPQNAVTPTPEAQGFKLPELPVSVDIADLNAQKIRLGQAILGEAVELNLKSSLSLSGGDGKVTVLANRTDGNRGQFKIAASYDQTQDTLSLDISLTEAKDGIAARFIALPGRPALDMTIKGAGPLSDFDSRVQIKTDGVERLGGTVRMGAVAPTKDVPDPAKRQFSADVQGDVTALFAPQYQTFFGDAVSLKITGTRAQDGALDISKMALKTQELSVSGAVSLDADLWPLQINLTGQMAGEGPVLLPLTGIETRIDRADLVVQYDALRNDQWTGNFVAQGLSRSDVRMGAISVSAKGVLDAQDAGGIGYVRAQVAAQASDVAFNDVDLSRAFGADIKAAFDLDYTEGQPLKLSAIDMMTDGARLLGTAIIQSLETGLATDLDARLSLQDMSKYAGLTGQALRGQADLGLKGRVALGGAFDLDVTGQTKDLRVGQADVDQLLRGVTDMNLSVDRTAQGVRVDQALIENKQVSLSGEGQFATGKSGADVTARLADASQFDPRLRGPASVTARLTQAAQGWSIDAKGSGPLGSEARVRGLATGPNAQLEFKAGIDTIRPFAPGLQGGVSLDGTLTQSQSGWLIRTDVLAPYGATAGVAGRISGGDIAVQYTARLPNLNVFVPQINGPLVLTGTARQQGSDIAINTDVRGPAGTFADVTGRVLGNGDLDVSAVGTAPLGLTEPFLTPRSLQGQARFDLAIKGAANLASVSGQITTQAARFSAPNVQVALTDIAATIALAQGRAQVNLNGAVKSGGRIKLTGPVTMSGGYLADLDVGLTGVKIADPALYKAVIDGRLKLSGELLTGAKVSGVIDLGQTDVLVPSSGITSFGELPAITHRGSRPAVTRTRQRAGIDETGARDVSAPSGPAYPLDILVTAPSRIFVRGRGLDAEFGGRLRLTGTTQAILSSGRFDLIRGRLDVLEKRFQLDEGSVQLQGSFDPYLRLVARTQVGSGSASVILEGRATSPGVRFEAVPEAPQDEVLAQIFFRRDIRQLSPFQAVQLASAVATLAGRGGEGVVSRLRRSFDLDDLDISSDEDGNTAVRVGKYISDEVYTDVTTNSKGDAEISINIDLTPNITARGSISNSSESKLGIFLEKDY